MLRRSLIILGTLLVFATIILNFMNIMELKKEISNLETEIQALKGNTDYKNFPNKYVGEFNITHYCHCPICTGKKGNAKVLTASGTIPKEHHTIAVDRKIIPLNSIVYIENLGYFIAEDTGGAIKGQKIDVYVQDHKRALELGTLKNRKFKVYVLGGTRNEKV